MVFGAPCHGLVAHGSMDTKNQPGGWLPPALLTTTIHFLFNGLNSTIV